MALVVTVVVILYLSLRFLLWFAAEDIPEQRVPTISDSEEIPSIEVFQAALRGKLPEEYLQKRYKQKQEPLRTAKPVAPPYVPPDKSQRFPGASDGYW